MTITVDGELDERGATLLAEVVRAALVAVGRARRIHVDLSRSASSEDLPPVLRQLELAGASITPAAGCD